jgi:glyoxylase-like metal-dependent hydrolase (beta-lactamase superfamily II)
MGWASSLVSPPDGDLTDFIASCRKLQLHHASVYYPGHGAPITKPEERLAWLISHRISREKQILLALKSQSATPEQIAKEIYHDLPEGLLHAAERNVFAHLIDLYQRGAVAALPNLSQAANFALKDGNPSD